ncbi:MAG: tetratricopeptide repeat protein [Desulfovibrionaceae bacterium]|nr:tetratricopeptide repeat protein [Desulfovibrionaceae bacterium]
MAKENQTPQGIMNEIGGEVSEENAPLLEFITKHGGKIAGAVLLFLLITGLSALWQWHASKSADEFLGEMAKITQMSDKKAALTALEALAEKAPSGLANTVQLTIADLALQSNDTEKAQKAYEACAKADGDGSAGTMAELSLAMTLLKKGSYKEALPLLTDLEKRFAPKTPTILLEYMAEASLGAGDAKRAAELFTRLSQEETGDTQAYYQYRARVAVESGEKKAAE